ncbi:MAG: BatD family protein [Flavobacteriales bacterium]|nr:BatD family protein [Flavobacteriales bacterium]MDW8432547.1 BatD family protein [Flavobacteriales bacterium]
MNKYVLRSQEYHYRIFVTFILGSVILLLPRLRLYGQEIKAEVSRNPVAVGEVFRITYKAGVPLEEFRMPRLSDFTMAGGPYQSISQTFINGRLTVSSSISYDLIPQKKGKYIIGAATARHEGRTITSNAIELEVVEGSGASAGGRPGPQEPSRPSRSDDGRDIFIRAFPSKSSVYPGEPFVLTVKLYTRLQTELRDIQMPRLKGAFIQEIPDAADKQFRLEVLDGQRYYAAVLRKLVVVAQRPGTLNLGKAGAEVKYQVVERTGDFWQDFMSGGRLRVFEKKLESAPIVVQVKDFPSEGRPDAFNGAAGNFQFQAALDAEKANTGDAIKLKMRLSGQGNLPLVDLPAAQVPPSFEVFEPKITDKISAGDNGLSGSREKEIILIPRSPGLFKITVPELAWFDYNVGKYQVQPPMELTLQVEGAQLSGPAGIQGPPDNRQQVDVIQDDIRYIKRGVALSATSRNTGAMPWWPVGLFFGAGLFLFLARPWVRKVQRNNEGVSGKRSARPALRLLREAEGALRQGNTSAFYALCQKALHRFLHDRYKLALNAMDRDQIKKTLAQAPELAASFMEVLDACEAARFAPRLEGHAHEEFLAKCRNLIEKAA